MTDQTTDDRDELTIKRNLATDIISAFVANNPTPAESLPQIVRQVYREVSNWGTAAPATNVVEAPRYSTIGGEQSSPPIRQEPAVPIKKSVTPDYIICLEDGKHFKSLKRHLDTGYGMTPDDYRARWGLPQDYPMVAPNYAKQRSALAKQLGLGRNAATARRARRDPPVEQPAEAGE